jgi:hypothetical protein
MIELMTTEKNALRRTASLWGIFGMIILNQKFNINDDDDDDDG